MKTYIVIAIIAIFFLYMVIWTLKLYSHTKRQKKVKRIQELRAKNSAVKSQSVDDTKDYWYNKREILSCAEEEKGRYYHYFSSVDEGVKELLLEMYDCGIVRTDELEQISYGKNRFQNMDLSFLQDLENDLMEKDDSEKSDEKNSISSEKGSFETESLTNAITDAANDAIIQVEGLTNEFFAKKNPDVVAAAKKLEKDDPGIVDIHGTLSEGMENVLAAVEAEKKAEDKKNEPIIVKEEKSIEEARKAREMTANAEIRNKVYDKWTRYVSELMDMVEIHSNEDNKKKIHKILMEYGYNDVDVLLESPE